MNTPLISVIIPTYNSAKKLPIAIESVLNQEYKGFEILIIDGNSTDQTIYVAKSYSSNRIQVISEPDLGIYDAMNKGVKLAKGDWVYFLGSDDRLFDATIFSKLLANSFPSIDVIYGNVFSTRWGGIYDGHFTTQKIIQKNICHQSIFFRKSIFEKIGFFDLRFKVYADWVYNWKWFFNDSIKHQYVPLIIAEYADGGYSSNKPYDPQFYRLKDSILKGLLNRQEWFYYMNKEFIRKEKELKKSASTLRLYLAKIKRLIFLTYSKILLRFN
jgi:glycosyltransferase involved in cell wall biosynthesis